MTDAKDRRYEASVDKALASFEAVVEWADYISFLSRLLKALQQKHTSQHWIPHSAKVAATLAKCLAPSLPSGVHQKTLEVYVSIFKELGVDQLASSIAIWIPGILPIMQFASISIKPLVIDLFKNFILTLPSHTLQNLIKPILSYLLLSIDDERSDYFDASLALIDNLKTELNNDALFWQSIFLIIITSEERRLGCLVWCNRRLPSLNINIEPPEQDQEQDQDNENYYKNQLATKLSSEQSAIINPETGLLIRAFTHALGSDNTLIQRGFFDLLIKNLQLDSTILQKASTAKDLQDLIMATILAILKKDMSINRRIWTWLLGSETNSSISPSEYFGKYGFSYLADGLLKLINGKYGNTVQVYDQKVSSFKIALSIMDRWEIGTLIIPEILIPILASIKQSSDSNAYNYANIVKSGSAFFDAVETQTIWNNLIKLVDAQNVDFLIFVIKTFNVQEEEMIVHHFPLLLIHILITSKPSENWLDLLNITIDLIPQRAYLPIEHANPDTAKLTNDEILVKIHDFYSDSDVNSTQPFTSADLSIISLNLLSSIVITQLKQKQSNNYPEEEYITLLTKLVEKIPNLSFSNADLIEILKDGSFHNEETINIAKLFSKIKFDSPLVQMKVLDQIVKRLCTLALEDEFILHDEIAGTLNELSLAVSPYYVEGSLTHFLLSLQSFKQRLELFNEIWRHGDETSILLRPLLIILDELLDRNTPNYSFLHYWILSNTENGGITQLLNILTKELAKSTDDNLSFTYYVSTIFNVISVDAKKLLPLFREEHRHTVTGADSSSKSTSYKEFTIESLQNFLQTKTFDAKTLNAVFKLHIFLLDGSESDLDSQVASAYRMSTNFISQNSTVAEYEEISVILLDHLKVLTKLEMDTKGNLSVLKTRESGKPFVIQFLLSSFENFQTAVLITSWVDLLMTVLMSGDDFVYEFIQDIVVIILDKMNSLYKCFSSSRGYLSITLLLDALQEVLSLTHSYVIALEVNVSKSPSHDPGFFSSVVSGVFTGDVTKGTADDKSSFKNRQVLSICFSEATKICFNFWKDLYQVSEEKKSKHKTTIMSRAFKLRREARNFLGKLYLLEPSEILRYLVSMNSIKEYPTIIKLLHVLDGTRPQFTMPHIFGIINEGFRNDSEKIMGHSPTTLEIGTFLVSYTKSLQDDAIEDIYGDSILFLKDVSNDLIAYRPFLLNILKFISIVAEKLQNSNFGKQKKVKREISDIFLKILPSSINIKDSNITSALSSNLNDQVSITDSTDRESLSSSVLPSQETLYGTVSYIIPKIKFITEDHDRKSTIISTILVNLLTPNLRSKSFPKRIQAYQLELLNKLSVHTPNFKSLKFLLNEVFSDPQFFHIKITDVGIWNSIIKNWLRDVSDEKLTDYMSKVTQSGGNIFSWSDNEQALKVLNLRRVSYILLIEDKDRHITLLKNIFENLDHVLTQSGDFSPITAEIFILIRVILLKFSVIHLYEHWTFIYTSLQNFFMKVLALKREKLEKNQIHTIFQACKLLDLLLVLEFEDFQEWIFIIDTINAVYKNAEIISLIDKISLRDELFKSESSSSSEKQDLLSNIDKTKGSRRPALIGIKNVQDMSVLKPFFDKLSYYNFENVYNGTSVDEGLCEQDLIADLFEG